MISVYYSEVSICPYSDYGCRDSSCPLNKLHKPKEATFGILDVPNWCLKTIDMVSDESLDSVVRNWIKAIHSKGEWYPIPQEVKDIIECKKPKVLPPLLRWMRGENVKVGPGVVISDNWKQPHIKNLIWHFRKHILGFLYKIYVFRFFHLFYLQWIRFSYYLHNKLLYRSVYHYKLNVIQKDWLKVENNFI